MSMPRSSTSSAAAKLIRRWVSAAEGAARDQKQVLADHGGDEFRAVAPGGLREEVKRPFGDDELEPVAQPGDDPVPLAAVVGRDRGGAVIPGRYARVLCDTWGAHVTELLQLA